MLALSNVDVFYGSVHALTNVSLHVDEGELVTLIGANGAGKSTTLRAISGLLRPKNGAITFQGEPIDKLTPESIVQRGVIHCPEGRRIFPDLTVSENLDMGAYTRKDKPEIRRDRQKVFELFPVLNERLKQAAGTLSGGEQQMLAIGRALLSKPLLLMFDEPSLGLAPQLVDQMAETIKELNNRGTTILLVEQNADVALQIADRAYLLETGNLVLEGSAHDLHENEHVKNAYLGG